MNALPAGEELPSGLAEPVLDSQRVFRATLDAMAHPGTIVDLTLRLSAPPPLHIATAALALTLADYETPLWLDAGAATSAVAAFLRFHCGCSATVPCDGAAFAIITAPAGMPPLAAFQAGSDEYPDRSTTLILQLPALNGGENWLLRGPGIPDSRAFAPAGLPAEFRGWVQDNHRMFPRGVDLIFTCGSSLAALPRSTRLEA
jgi:alpha-D-ribose 1-methylphosphonate 5-triphosphate synthase subunit PhnH